MSPVARTAPKARSVTQGSIRWPCQGFVDAPNTREAKDILEKCHLDFGDAMSKSRLDTGTSRVAKWPIQWLASSTCPT